MKILIYGGGSVGLGVASCLIKAGAGVDIIAREETALNLQKQGLKRIGIFGDYYASPDKFGAYEYLDQIPRADYDLILVCTKSFDSAAAAADLSTHKALFAEQTKIVLFQNGWSNAQAFTSFFPESQIFNARVITGFRRPKENEVEVTVHADAIHIGSLFDNDLACIDQLCRFISDGDIPCEKTEYIAEDLWAKMLYNCALNPLGAVLDVPYGQLAEYESTRKIMDSIVGEIFTVMTAAGYKTHCPQPSEFLKVFYDQLVPDTAEHKSSTLQDILAGKKTEIDALTGSVLKLAQEHNIDVPCNRALYNMIKFLEGQNAHSE